MRTTNQGGPAFPVNDAQIAHRVGMMAIQDVPGTIERDRIYTEATARASQGMTLRDYFAAKAMQVELERLASQLKDQTTDFDCWEDAQEYAASMAYSMAEAMLEARDPTGGGITMMAAYQHEQDRAEKAERELEKLRTIMEAIAAGNTDPDDMVKLAQEALAATDEVRCRETPRYVEVWRNRMKAAKSTTKED